jgi:ferredoxin
MLCLCQGLSSQSHPGSVAEHAKPQIIPERCIGCGSCWRSCGPEAIEVRDSKEKLQRLLKGEKKVAALVDPSIAGEFPDISDYRKFVQMLRTLGFSPGSGSGLSGWTWWPGPTGSYSQHSKGKYYIMSNDPVTVSFVEKYRTSLVPNLAPILPPVAATAQVARHLGEGKMVLVYISPLIARKDEIRQFEGDSRIDLAITFVELRELFQESGDPRDRSGIQ